MHHDDVASALRAAVLGEGEPGVYNLAADGTLTMADVARELDWYRLPIPQAAVTGAAELVGRLSFLPPGLAWVHALRVASIMKTDRAREKLGWTPRHDGQETLRQTVECARANGLVV